MCTDAATAGMKGSLDELAWKGESGNTRVWGTGTGCSSLGNSSFLCSFPEDLEGEESFQLHQGKASPGIPSLAKRQALLSVFVRFQKMPGWSCTSPKS